jgi:hypothetical protein
MELPVLWYVIGEQPYCSVVEQSTHTLKPRLTRCIGIIFLHLHFIYILSVSNRI